MSVDGTIFEFDLIWRMQLSDDLQNAWMMFDHIKRVQGWKTMACHVYNMIYCKVMMITICDMQFEDTEAQCIMWRKLNAIVEGKGLGTPIFKGFMANGAQANWNVVRTVYGTGDPIVKMVDEEHMCFFHWIQSFDKHAKQLIMLEFHDQHKALCYDYKTIKFLEEANF
jgi:hypothetical protein